MLEFSLTIFSLLIIYLINKYKKKISKKTKLLDRPDSIRKLHKKTTPLLGGIMAFSTFLLINLYLIFLDGLNKTSFIIFACSLSCLTLGLIDDVKRVSYKYKFLILIAIFYLFISLDPNLRINKIYFATLNENFYLGYLSIPFTILCLLLLTNAINLIDGIDGLCILISIIFITWLINTFQNIEPLYIVMIISLIYILYLNLNKNIFLGDSGSLFLGCLIGLNIILNYNQEILKIDFPVENIFIALMLPGLDMLRVFAIRLVNKKNPFSPDRMHLHHLLLNRKFTLRTILMINFILILTPISMSKFFNISQISIILTFIFFYLIFVFYLKKIFFNS
jgi:UDP-GlcNAc:undecaprenyl-phosphate/decaprenyl-phosphate GlcNAc-1-phosphate transferase